MALDRLLPVSTTPGAITGDDYMDAVQEEVTGLWDRAVIKLTNVAGTNDITADEVPALTGALIDGMKFELVPAATNTSTTVRLNIDGTLRTVVDRDGAAPVVGSLKIGSHYLLTWNSGDSKFYVMDFLEPLDFADRPGFRNILMDNGGFEIWQRGAGNSASIAVAASTTAYTADRWYIITGANEASVISAQAGLTDRSRLCGRVQRNSGQTGTTAYVFAYPLTVDECIRFRNKKVTLQMFLRAGANWSPTSGTLTYDLYFGTGTEGKRGAGFTSESNPISSTVNLTAGGSAVQVTATSGATVGTTVSQGELRLTWTPVGTAGAADYVEIDDVQIENGDVVTEFEYTPFGLMLAECQRHYRKTFPYGTAPAQNAGTTGSIMTLTDGNVAAFSLRLFPNMRTAPTVTTFNPSAANASWRHTDSSEFSNTTSDAADSGFTIGFSGAGGTAGRVRIHATMDAGL